MDTYDRVARLYPAYIALFPLTLLIFGCYSTHSWWSALTPIIAAVGLPYLLADRVRRYGKHHQPNLYDNWGGPPTTTLLRLTTTSTNPVLRDRWRSKVEELAALALPTAREETDEPQVADQRYLDAIAAVRPYADTDPVLRRENRQYGFWRNLYGIRNLVVASGIAAAVASVAVLVVAVTTKVAVLTPVVLLACIVGSSWVYLGRVIISEEAVRRQGFEYAERFMQALLR